MLIRQLLKLTRTLFLSESKKMDTSGQSSFTVWTEAKPPPSLPFVQINHTKLNTDCRFPKSKWRLRGVETKKQKNDRIAFKKYKLP